MKAGVILGLSIGLIPMLTPVILNPSMAGAILLHGSTGAALITTAVVVAIIFFVAKRQRPANNTVDGKPKLRRIQVFALISFILFAMFGFISASEITEYHRLVTIRQHGLRAEAEVVRIYTDGCGRSSCSLNAEYRYTLSTSSSAKPIQVIGYGYLASDRHLDDPRLVHARDMGHVPIAYDVDNPQVSAINFDDSVFKDDHFVKVTRILKLFGTLALVCLGPLAILFAAVPISSQKPALT